MPEYKILFGSSLITEKALSELEQNVRQYLGGGWQLHGAPFWNSDGSVFQAVVRNMKSPFTIMGSGPNDVTY